jgi:hypothetical protein
VLNFDEAAVAKLAVYAILNCNPASESVVAFTRSHPRCAYPFPSQNRRIDPTGSSRPNPENLIAAGDIGAMRGLLQLAGDGDLQDSARQFLFTGAAISGGN